MKALTQVVLPIAIVVAVVGGITFVLHYRNTPTPTNQGPAAPDAQAAGSKLVFHGGLLGKSLDTDFIPEFEVDKPGTLDFLVLNPTTDAFKLGLESRKGSCKQVQAGILTSKEWSQYGSDKALAACQLVDKENRWQTVSEDRKVEMPAGEGPDKPAAAIIRLTCQASDPTEERIAAKFQVEQGFSKSNISQGARVRFVPPIMVAPADIRFPPLTAESQKETAEFICWSASRPQFTLTAREESGDPGFECVTKALTAKELQNLARSKNITPLTGYRVQVSVTGGKEFDLGLFTRWIELKSDVAKQPLRVKVAGVVRGELTLEAPSNLDWIDFGEFPSARGASRTVYLEGDQPQPDLKVVACQPSYLKLDFKPVDKDAPSRWELRVRVPPRALKGRIPTGSGIKVEMQGGRKMWIPVTGQAIQ